MGISWLLALAIVTVLLMVAVVVVAVVTETSRSCNCLPNQRGVPTENSSSLTAATSSA